MTSVAPPAVPHPQAEVVGEAVAPVAPADRAAQVAVVAAAVAALAASDDRAEVVVAEVVVAGGVAAEERHRPAPCQPMPVWCRPTAPAWPVHCPRED